MASDVRLVDGAFDFSVGVNSGVTTTLRSALTVNGLRRNELAWAGNCTVRGGGITCRNGWKPLVNITQITALAYAQGATGLYQGGWLYDTGFGIPYLICSIGGRIYKVELEAPYAVIDLSTISGLTNPATVPMAHFCQGLQFLVIQAGDFLGQYRVTPTPPPAPSTGTFAGFTVPATGDVRTLTLDAAYPGVVGDTISIHLDTNNFDLIGQVTFINGLDITYVAKPSLVQPVGFAPAGTFIVTITNSEITGSPTLPLFWDGTTLRRSIGITNTAPASMSNGINEIPAATAMDFYMQRFWYVQGQTWSGGDIAGGPSGTAAYQRKDSILNVTENPLCFGGDGFTVPDNAGNVRAITHTDSTNGTLGEGDLYIATRKSVYKMVVPVTRADWIAADSNNQPKITVAQGRGGMYGDRSVVAENSDLFYRSPSGALRSLKLVIVNDGQWGNTGIANNLERLFAFEDRSMLPHSSGISFDNRMLQTCMPIQTSAGVAFQGLIALDFDLISTLQVKLPPAYDGIFQGLQILQSYEGDFGGVQRAFAAIVSEIDGSIQVWELTNTDRFDDQDNPDGDHRVEWYFETPAWTWGKEMEMKRLDGLEMWVDKVFGTLDWTVEFRPDADACWHHWASGQICSAKSSCETTENPVCYPEQPYRENFKYPITLPTPPQPECNTMNKRPVDLGFQQQVRVTMKGWGRIRGLIVFALPYDRDSFGGLGVC